MRSLVAESLGERGGGFEVGEHDRLERGALQNVGVPAFMIVVRMLRSELRDHLDMLLDLAKADRALTLTEWMDEFGERRGMRVFLEDRLHSILVPLRLVSLNGDQVTLTKSRGRLLANLLDVLAFALLKKSQ